MKNYREILSEKTIKKLSPSNSNDIRAFLDKLSKEVGPGRYQFEADGFKRSEAEFTFKATFKVLDDKGAWVLTKGKRSFFSIIGFSIRPIGSGKANILSIKDIEQIRVTI
jgi:hypothetical protein